ncbi:MAG: glycosyltransferase, partial [Bacteroidetes bacterium]|nr:glycosyltransferase [Bacteroidota bacterium]
MTYASIILVVCLAVYVRQIFYFYRGLSRLPAGSGTEIHSVTVIVPARNEEMNIERCLRALLAQDYPAEKLSIIIIDDQSDDRTAEIVRTMSAGARFPVTLLSSDIDSSIRSPKIRA